MKEENAASWEEFETIFHRIEGFRQRAHEQSGVGVSDLLYRGQADSRWREFVQAAARTNAARVQLFEALDVRFALHFGQGFDLVFIHPHVARRPRAAVAALCAFEPEPIFVPRLFGHVSFPRGRMLSVASTLVNSTCQHRWLARTTRLLEPPRRFRPRY